MQLSDQLMIDYDGLRLKNSKILHICQEESGGFYPDLTVAGCGSGGAATSSAGSQGRCCFVGPPSRLASSGLPHWLQKAALSTLLLAHAGQVFMVVLAP
jgi:hypothetical protein